MAKVLIVEDEIIIASMYDFKLRQRGHDVHQAHNGKDGLQYAEKIIPDAILLDINMPFMNGDEMLKLMRSTVWGERIKVIILTNISRDEASHKFRFLHVDRYIVKAHHTPSQVAQIVEDVLA
jgi:DNA-binding response OmpR family regulator